MGNTTKSLSTTHSIQPTTALLLPEISAKEIVNSLTPAMPAFTRLSPSLRNTVPVTETLLLYSLVISNVNHSVQKP